MDRLWVLRILCCRDDKWVVPALAKKKAIIRVREYKVTYRVVDKTTGRQLPDKVSSMNGINLGDRIYVADMSDEEAASTLYHEALHDFTEYRTGSAKERARNEEIMVRRLEEARRIRRLLPEKNPRTWEIDHLGRAIAEVEHDKDYVDRKVLVPDLHAIAAFVDTLYPENDEKSTKWLEEKDTQIIGPVKEYPGSKWDCAKLDRSVGRGGTRSSLRDVLMRRLWPSFPPFSPLIPRL